MAFQPETGSYEAGIFQLEIDTPVQGGLGGASNLPLLQLANRTAYLKAHVDALESAGFATLASPNFTGSPTAPTPALFDDDTSIATTAFVMRAAGNFRGVRLLSANTTLTTADVGLVITTTAAASGITITLPLTSAYPPGAAITFRCGVSNLGTYTVAAQGGDAIGTGNGVSVSSIIVKGYDTFTLVRGAAGQWLISTGYVSDVAMPASLVTNGYQKLPSGLIIQWGTVTLGAGQTSGQTINFPIAFPNACLSLSVTEGTVSTQIPGSVSLVGYLTDSITTSSFKATAVDRSTGSITGSAANWTAIGY